MILYVIITIMIFYILKFTFYINISKYLTYSRISRSIYIDVLHTMKLRLLNRHMSDNEITEDFYQDAQKAIDKLKPGKRYIINTHSLIKRHLQNNSRIEINEIKENKKSNLNILNFIIGKSTFKEKQHKTYMIKFMVKQE